MQATSNTTNVWTAGAAGRAPTVTAAATKAPRRAVPFAITLKDALAAGAEPAAKEARMEEARGTARELVSALFYEPMLAEMRQFPFGQKFGNGGRAEEIFGERLDQLTAAAVVSRQRGGLIDLIAADIAEKSGEAKEPGRPVTQE